MGLVVITRGTALVFAAFLMGGRLCADSYAITPIQYPGATQTTVRGLNDAGQVAGFWANANSSQGGDFIYSNGNFLSIPVSPLGINNADQVLTQIDNAGYIYQNGSYTPITYPGSAKTFVSALSNNGYVTGTWVSTSNVQNAFLFENGSYTLFPLTTYLVPEGINDQGIVVGSDEVAAEGFIRNADGSITEVGYPGASATLFDAINDSGEILGRYVLGGSGPTYSFLYENGVFIPLPQQFDGDFATGFNNEGQIAGTLLAPSGGAFLATPVPEPASADLGVVLLASAIFAAHRRRQRA